MENINKYIENIEKYKTIYTGKVRQVKEINEDLLILTASNRLSAFDKHICNINTKGVTLNNMSSWWFQNTKHIVDNHYLYHKNEYMIVKKTKPIKLEFVVRGYITGSTDTSLWTLYNLNISNLNNMYSINLRTDYKKNEKLDKIIVTPTTKGTTDIPINKDKIIEDKYLTEEEYKFIYDKSIELFKYGQDYMLNKGLILVDTKYEFGRIDNKIILIDEIHTCDSSRYWKLNTYNKLFTNNNEPEKLDKDIIRDWIKTQCNPYIDNIPEIPNNLIKKVEDIYTYYNDLFNNVKQVL
jgi:phosphoribosylaminoimidazole-succinocarboxamide synthase